MGVVLTWKATDKGPGGTAQFDIVVSENLVYSSTITEFPVESGANISDHVRPNLDTLTLDVMVSNTPLHGDNLLTGGTRGDITGIELEIPQPKRSLLGLTNLINAGLSLLAGPKAPPKAQVLAFDADFSATGETLDQLRQLQREARLVDVISRDWFLENMVIVNVTAPRNAADGSCARFNIEFRQIRIVETKQTTAPVPSEVRGKATVNAGKQDGKDASQKKSFAKSLKDKFAPNLF